MAACAYVLYRQNPAYPTQSNAAGEVQALSDKGVTFILSVTAAIYYALINQG